MSYVPPHLRGTAPAPRPPNTWRRVSSMVKPLRLVPRRKAIVIPKLHGKYVVVRHHNKNNPGKSNVTFIGGGCPKGANLTECALKELHEESRKAINRFNFKLKRRNNLNFLGNRSKEGVTKARPGGFLQNNLKNGNKVNMMYHIFEGTPTRRINFHTIKKRFNSINISKLPNKYKETSNIMLISNRNLRRMPANQKYFIVNKILTQQYQTPKTANSMYRTVK